MHVIILTKNVLRILRMFNLFPKYIYIVPVQVARQIAVIWKHDRTVCSDLEMKQWQARNRTSLTGRTGNMVAIVVAVELSPSCLHPSCYVLCFACSNNLRNMCCGVGIEWNRQRSNKRGEAAQQISWVYTGLKQPVHIFKTTHGITLTSLMSV